MERENRNERLPQVDYDATPWDGGLELERDPFGEAVMAFRRKVVIVGFQNGEQTVLLSDAENALRAVLSGLRHQPRR